MEFVLALHSHLPRVLNHGRWPHGSDWITEAAIDTYLPLLLTLERLEREGVPAPVTLGLTPVLASQLCSPDYRDELGGISPSGSRPVTPAPPRCVPPATSPSFRSSITGAPISSRCASLNAA